MKKFLVLAAALLSLGACTTTERGAAVGATAGAIVGGVGTGTIQGAAIGAAAGGVIGALVGHVAGSDNLCTYRAKNGRLYTDYCPKNYKY